MNIHIDILYNIIYIYDCINCTLIYLLLIQCYVLPPWLFQNLFSVVGGVVVYYKKRKEEEVVRRKKDRKDRRREEEEERKKKEERKKNNYYYCMIWEEII